MSLTIRGGVVLGALVFVWTFLMGVTGWYKDPVLSNLFWIVVLIQIAVLLWALTKTAAVNGFARQVFLGTLISMIASIPIFLGSLLFTTVAYPHYFEEVAAVQEEALRKSGRTAEEIRTTLELAEEGATPMTQAIAGVVGTVLTGILASAMIAVFHRRRGGPEVLL
jgi:hypothetical protein